MSWKTHNAIIESFYNFITNKIIRTTRAWVSLKRRTRKNDLIYFYFLFFTFILNFFDFSIFFFKKKRLLNPFPKNLSLHLQSQESTWFNSGITQELNISYFSNLREWLVEKKKKRKKKEKKKERKVKKKDWSDWLDLIGAVNMSK